MDRKRFILFVSIPALVILMFVGIKLFTLSFGQEILLKTAPVDPRDMFRGDYVRLSYEITRIDLSKLPDDTSFSTGEAIYAVLSKKEKFWAIDWVSHEKPSLDENQVRMKGKVIRSSNKSLFVEWEIESYFVAEGKGRLIERQRNARITSVIVSVDSSGSSVLKTLLINDEPVEFE